MNRAQFHRISGLSLALALASLTSCTNRPESCKADSECPGEERCIEQVCDGQFTQAITIVGKKDKVPPEWLNAGKEAYTLYCRSCHGGKGRGDGPASFALRPPPRDLSIATYKFAGVIDGLPHDEDFTRILTGGLTGTAMLPWDLPKDDLYAVMQYIKTFSAPGEAWRDPEGQLGQRVIPPADPWKSESEAVERGKMIYHTVATCQSCHPAYATRKEVYDLSLTAKAEGLRKDAIVEFRKEMFQPEAKESTAYQADGVKMRILPPDFLVNNVRSISPRRPQTKAADLFRLIGSGISGTAMPAWTGAMPDKDIWAMTHYVKSLIATKDTAAAAELQSKLTADVGEFVVPAAAAPPAVAPPAVAPPAKSPAKSPAKAR